MALEKLTVDVITGKLLVIILSIPWPSLPN